MIDYDYALHSALFTLLRALDLLTTWHISRDLSREMNPLYRAIGWRWTIIVNLGLCAFIYRWPLFYWSAVVVTTLVIFWNVGIILIQPALKLDVLEKLRKTKWRKRRMRMKVKRLTR